MNDDHDEMVQNWIDECAANGWDINGVPLNLDSKPSPWVADGGLRGIDLTPSSGSIPKDIDDFPGPEDFGLAPQRVSKP